MTLRLPEAAADVGRSNPSTMALRVLHRTLNMQAEIIELRGPFVGRLELSRHADPVRNYDGAALLGMGLGRIRLEEVAKEDLA